ncbi:MAG: hypothetical protein KF838_12430 [Phycisphaeraceae bacterium]|nr:MAG: hypothetical protein KF838_12430 [Phycisphaeraceae bacterium]
MRARVTVRGLVPIIGKGRDARELDVIPWEAWDPARGYVLRDGSGRIARIEGKRAVVELASASERRVAGKAWRRAIARGWREGTSEFVGGAGSDVWAMRFMGMMVLLVVGMAGWMFVPLMVEMVRAGVSTWMDAAVIAISVVVVGGMMVPFAIFAALLWDVRGVWTGSLPRVIRMTREGVSCTDGQGREGVYAWADCERVRVGFGGTLWFAGGERVTLLGLGVKGRRILGWVREEIDAREGRSARRSMFVAVLIVLCVLNGVFAAGSGAMTGAGTGAIPWVRVATAFAGGLLMPAALLGALLYGDRVTRWWEKKRMMTRRRARG